MLEQEWFADHFDREYSRSSCTLAVIRPTLSGVLDGPNSAVSSAQRGPHQKPANRVPHHCLALTLSSPHCLALTLTGSHIVWLSHCLALTFSVSHTVCFAHCLALTLCASHTVCLSSTCMQLSLPATLSTFAFVHLCSSLLVAHDGQASEQH